MPSFLGNKIRKLTTDLFDLPPDVALNVPRITMLGSLQLYIENHRGVAHFSDEELRLRIDQGEFIISGKGLKIRAIYPEEVFVDGNISSISFTQTNKGGS